MFVSSSERLQPSAVKDPRAARRGHGLSRGDLQEEDRRHSK